MMKALLAFGAIAMLATYVNGQTGKRRAVKTGSPNGIFSPAIVTGDLVYTSGQIGIDPKTSQLPEGFEAQLDQVFKNLTAVLEASGSDIDHVIKATVFLADMNDYNKLNELYPKKFKGDPPARTCVQVARLPRDARVEIEVVAVLK
ncbi:MAG TPA: Rid family detoxifying hydrolase [Pyrinomonadaceae bacterium]|nr:Rid family detoxifying hydrolase [Pyrinomonadaceae bacterium]